MIAHRFAFAAMLVIITACATATTPEQQAALDEKRANEVFANDARRGEQVDRLCFASQIDGFGETTDRAVVVSEGLDQYLIETYPGCFDLDWAQSLAVDSFSSCLTRGDKIFAFDNVFGPDRNDGINQACRVKAIYEWNKDAKSEAPTETETTESDTETP